MVEDLEVGRDLEVERDLVLVERDLVDLEVGRDLVDQVVVDLVGWVLDQVACYVE